MLHISPHGFWLFLYEQEYFLAFEHFPWFRQASITSLLEVQLPQPHRLYWPKLDVDLEVASIIAPENYPLVDRRGLSAATPPFKKSPAQKAEKSRVHKTRSALIS